SWVTCCCGRSCPRPCSAPCSASSPGSWCPSPWPNCGLPPSATPRATRRSTAWSPAWARWRSAWCCSSGSAPRSCIGALQPRAAPAASAPAPPPGTHEKGPLARAFFLVPSDGRSSGHEQRLHLLQRIGFDLSDPLGGHAVLVGQFLQGHLGVRIKPAALDDVA